MGLTRPRPMISPDNPADGSPSRQSTPYGTLCAEIQAATFFMSRRTHYFILALDSWFSGLCSRNWGLANAPRLRNSLPCSKTSAPDVSCIWNTMARGRWYTIFNAVFIRACILQCPSTPDKHGPCNTNYGIYCLASSNLENFGSYNNNKIRKHVRLYSF